MIVPIGKYTINFDYLAYAIDDEEVETVILTMARKTWGGQSQIVLAGADRDTFFEIVRHEYNRRVAGKSFMRLRQALVTNSPAITMPGARRGAVAKT